MRRQPARRVRHLQAVAPDAAVLAVALDALAGLRLGRRRCRAPCASRPGAASAARDSRCRRSGPSSVWHEAQMPLPRSRTTGPWDLRPARWMRHLEPVVALGAEVLLLMALAALRGGDVQRHGDLGRLAGTPLTWQVLHVSGSCTPSWQRAQIDILFCDERDTASSVPGMTDVGVAGEALVAGLTQPLVIDADVADDDVLLDLRVGVALLAVGVADVAGDRTLVGVGRVQDEVGHALQIADEVVEDAGLGVALLAADAGAVVRGVLVGHHFGLDDVADVAGGDVVERREHRRRRS